jgi:hypothetical protein
VKRKPAAVWVVVGLALAALIWSVSRPNYRELRLEDGTVVLGSNDGLWWVTRQFFSVRLENAKAGAKLRSTARLALRGREFALRDVTLADMDALGADVSPNHPADAQHRSVGFGEQNREGILEFVFAGSSLQGFYARCSKAAPCDFELSWPGRPGFRLPVPQADVSRVFVDVASMRDHYGH